MPLWALLILGATLLVAYANGANDNFKGVATPFGSGTTGYHKALGWATAATLAGSLTACFVATTLVNTFRGEGLIPSALVGSEPFLVAVILGAALTVFFATQIGMPISTTHSLTGALLGGSLMAVGFDVGFDALWKSFVIPLSLSPLIAVVLSGVAYPLFSRAAAFIGMTQETCICAGAEPVPIAVTAEGHFMTAGTKTLHVVVDHEANCVQRYSGKMLGVNAQTLLDGAHYVSAGAVSFARGLNDTPKIVALCVTAGALNLGWGVPLVACTMAMGGLVHARKVAETLSKNITEMDHGQGFVASLVTSVLVIVASTWGLPVSTTHVSSGALFGIGVVNGNAR